MPDLMPSLLTTVSQPLGSLVAQGRDKAILFTSPNNPLDKAGSKVGITFNPARRIIKTEASHRLVEWCKEVEPAKEDALMEVMFKAYFEEASDLSKHDALVACATAAGLDAEAAKTMLTSTRFQSEVTTKVMTWQQQQTPCKRCCSPALQPAPAAQHLLHASQLRHLQPSPTSPLLLRSALNARLSGKGLVTARREWCAFFRDPPEEWRTARRLLRSSAARDDCGCLTRAGRGVNHNNSIWTAGLGFKAHGRLVSGPLAPHP